MSKDVACTQNPVESHMTDESLNYPDSFEEAFIHPCKSGLTGWFPPKLAHSFYILFYFRNVNKEISF